MARGRAGAGSSARGPLRVLFVDESATFGGAIISLGHLVSTLDPERVQATVVSRQPAERLRELFPGHEAIHLPYWVPWERREGLPWIGRIPGALPARGAWELLTKRLGTARELAAIGRRVGAELVHLNNVIQSQVDGALAALLLGVPCVAHARGFQEPARGSRLAARLPAAHVAISSEIAADLARLGVEEARIRVIHNGIDPAAFEAPGDVSALRSSLGLPADAPVLGFFGRIVRWKGVLELVEAAGLVLGALPAARVLVVGDESDGSQAYVREVHSRVDALGIADRVTFTGYRKDVPALMAAVDVVVHTSIEPEPFGLVLVEAMAAAKPVVAAAGGGPRDIVAEGETGHLVDPADAREVARAVVALLRDPERARAMGRAGRERVLARFSRRAEAHAMEALYHEIVPPRRAVS